MIDRVPPQNIEAEQAVLGAMLLEREAIAKVMEKLRSEDFYREAHKVIFNAMLELYNRNEAVDLVTVTEVLKKNGKLEDVGGIAYVTSLANSVPTAANVVYHAGIVEEKSILRQLVRSATEIAELGYEGSEDVSDIIDSAEKKILDISNRKKDTDFVPINNIVMDSFKDLEALMNNKNGLTGLPTGFVDFDNLTSGLHGSDFIILAARPSMGKTALSLNIVQNVAIRSGKQTDGKPKVVAFFSLEMSKEQLVQRMLCAEANIDSQRLRIGELRDEDWIQLILMDEDDVYADIMVEEEEALKHISPKSLLVLVDHHRKMLCASQKVLDAIPWRIIIDHHRRAEDAIKNTTLQYMEPSSSSTSELVTELVGYFNDRLEFTKGEATALYAGIVVDTKNFAVQTGERTFEAAALLRRSGADPNMVRQLFKDDLDSVQVKSRLVAEAEMPEPGMVISVYENAPKEVKSSVIAAQAADTMINITGVCMSVVITEYSVDGSLGVSARSDGTVNVQIIMEELGGGGHQTVAGVQLKNISVEEVKKQIIALAKKQLEENDNNESDSAAGR